jgi:hypothetical protein
MTLLVKDVLELSGVPAKVGLHLFGTTGYLLVSGEMQKLLL